MEEMNNDGTLVVTNTIVPAVAANAQGDDRDPALKALRADIAATLNEAELAASDAARLARDEVVVVEQEWSTIPVVTETVKMVPVENTETVKAKEEPIHGYNPDHSPSYVPGPGPRPFLNADSSLKTDFVQHDEVTHSPTSTPVVTHE
jgi:hypothetical protein